MVQDWLLRIGDGEHFTKSIPFQIWGIDSTSIAGKFFVGNAKPEDRLWFLRSKGKAVSVATFVQFRKREIGPLLSFTLTNEELGWSQKDGTFDTEVHYKDLKDIEARNICADLSGNVPIRLVNDRCKVDLPEHYRKLSEPPLPTTPTTTPTTTIRAPNEWVEFQKRVQLVLNNKFTGRALMMFCKQLKARKHMHAWLDTEIRMEAMYYRPPPRKQKNEDSDDKEEDTEQEVKPQESKPQEQKPPTPPLTPSPEPPAVVQIQTQLQPQQPQQQQPQPQQPQPQQQTKRKEKIPKKVRIDVWNTYIGEAIGKHKCLCCKRTTIDKSEFDCGHVVAEANGGGPEIHNLRPICNACNNSMGTMNMIDYVMRHGYFIG